MISKVAKKSQYTRIAHVDMDAFFSSIEELDNPKLKGRPVIVGSDPKNGKGRGVVSTCNYIARKYGVHSAQAINRAFYLCPNGIFLQPRYQRYLAMSLTIKSIFNDFSPLVEDVGIDEAYIECSGSRRLFGNDEELGLKIKNQIFTKTGLTASVGIAPNKYIAKISSELQKPDGLTICKPGEEKEFLSELPIERLWGAGKKTISILKSNGIFFIGQLANMDIDDIYPGLGKRGQSLWKLANGIDHRKIECNNIRKSISEEKTFEFDLDDEKIITHTIRQISERLGHNIRKEKFKFKTIQLKIRLSGFRTYTRNISISQYSNLTKSIRENALQLYKKFKRDDKVRLIGLSLQQLLKDSNENSQLDLFAKINIGESNKKSTQRDFIYDALKFKFQDSLKTASTISLN